MTALPAEAARPVKGAVQGTATAATGVAKGTVQAGRRVVSSVTLSYSTRRRAAGSSTLASVR